MNQFVDNPVNIVLIMVFVLNAVLATLIFLNRGKSEGSGFFALSAYATSVWVVAMLYFRQISNIETLLLPTKTLYISGILIALLFFYFSYDFLGIRKITNTFRTQIFAFAGILTAISIYLIISSKIIINQTLIESGNKIVTFGDGYFGYSLLMVFLFFWSFTEFFKKIKKFSYRQQLEKRQLIYIMTGTGISILAGLIFDIILPAFGNFTFYWLGPVLTSIFVTFTAYSIFKHHLFSLKVIATELFAFLLWLFLLARTLLSQTWQEQLINGTLFIATLIFGALLIKSVIHEVETREKIEKLAKELEKTNERLKELDQLKSEFVSLATHQIRGPLTAIKGYASMMRDGDYGEVPARIKGTVDIIFESSNALTTVVQDFLDISRIEQGRMKYELTVFDFSKLVQSVGEELAPVGERRGLRVKLEIEPNIIVEADTGKMRQIIGNLIDNAIKYTSRGHIIVSLKKSGANARLEVKDTGVGIRPETLPKLFQKFSRAEDASKANVLGTGLGLYAAKKLLEAQSGTIWAESEGEEKGSTFSVELPSV
ncbi:MAG: hypothetical protein A2W52_01540 [Candidatus Taylorbacteria bacterium RIFCSPHIGHO2_02_49_25]|uniref:histidine kinase n=1 Tax=Candidatus Taylorbacteria bacterium RIFCSPHIGHO2_02_49_25 TaxID=1802305 RepID=A0A1G2MDP4_9BACT|nr:MAG: hypothetical protein A2W52_01540 [Candidatus Taylorbacteria bacterium RIFCSPHIGHO2_02_49_25]OHA35721.1 MAG: hypothetical protein A2W65_02270 [Candidatus Taylorbacteria bacterium RIFCSPLOWO2_02_50_13]